MISSDSSYFFIVFVCAIVIKLDEYFFILFLLFIFRQLNSVDFLIQSGRLTYSVGLARAWHLPEHRGVIEVDEGIVDIARHNRLSSVEYST